MTVLVLELKPHVLRNPSVLWKLGQLVTPVNFSIIILFLTFDDPVFLGKASPKLHSPGIFVTQSDYVWVTSTYSSRVTMNNYYNKEQDGNLD